jgi:hypothetical protein
MENYNCGTCVFETACFEGRGVPKCKYDGVNQTRHDKHPSDMHPGSEGKATVASAIADYKFYELPHGDIHACHEHGGIVFHDAWQYEGMTGWAVNMMEFCGVCGMRLLNATRMSELTQMYDQAQANKEAT